MYRENSHLTDSHTGETIFIGETILLNTVLHQHISLLYVDYLKFIKITVCVFKNSDVK